MQSKLLLSCIFICFLQACASGSLVDDLKSEGELFENAQSYLEQKNYPLAISQLESLATRFPFGLYSNEVKLQLIYAHYQNNAFSIAALHAERFIRFNLDHEQLDYAYFIKAMSYYSEYQSSASALLKRGPEGFDQSSGKEAFTSFQQLTTVFPSTQYRAQSQAKMRILKENFAAYENRIGLFYLNGQNYVAAINRANYVMGNFPETQQQGDALSILILANNALGNQLQSDQALSLLTKYFPEHLALQSGSFKTPFIEEKRLWVRILTLGFFN
ncbi:MAG: outer membrane protein assembly factor BamD [Saccharospirillaceae bacterium]|nr:outer membrane protein assembly factor BamD [Pseudomonadales bacterium]NRB78623.1 outer membrane protein assembly factor BamD [Saccharospirillaceae bacterium]